ncbi:hypothetical protein SGPA1_21919 [Streptomyces misionensis JCM 4497]
MRRAPRPLRRAHPQAVVPADARTPDPGRADRRARRRVPSPARARPAAAALLPAVDPGRHRTHPGGEGRRPGRRRHGHRHTARHPGPHARRVHRHHRRALAALSPRTGGVRPPLPRIPQRDPRRHPRPAHRRLPDRVPPPGTMTPPRTERPAIARGSLQGDNCLNF